MSLRLTPAHSFSYALCDFLLLRRPDLAQVYALGDQFLQHLAYQVFVDLVRINLGRAEQGAQTRLVLYGSRRQNRAGGRRSWRLAAPRASVVAASSGVSALIATSLTSSPITWRAQSVIAASTRYAHLSQTQRLDLCKHALVILTALLAPSQLRQNIISGLVLGSICRLLFITLPSLRIPSHIVV